MRTFFIFLLACFAQLHAQALDVYYAHLAFKSPSGQYVETQFCILNSSLHFVKTPDKTHRAEYGVQLFFINSNNDTIKQERYTLQSPDVKDPNGVNFDLVDIRRNSLPSGTYKIGLVVSDLHGTPQFFSQRELKLYFPGETVSFSSPLLVKKFRGSVNTTNYTRAGFDILPYPLAYFPDSMSKLTIYYEAYNLFKATSDTNITFKCTIRNTHNETLPEYTAIDIQRTDSFNIFFASLDIARLKSGRYFLQLDAFDSDTNLLGTTGFHFARAVRSTDGYKNLSNIQVDETFAGNINRDSLWMWLNGLEYESTPEEKELIQAISKSKDTLQALQFIYVFMQHRQPDDPEDSWLVYTHLFEEVEYNFGTPVRHGYETDRGRVFLRYGSPDQRNVSTNEPGAYPYEVWQFYRLSNSQSNVYFVFYLPGLATNDYKLIHSNARGETQEPHWKQKIYPMNPSADPDKTSIDDHFGKRIDTFIPR